MPVTLEQFAQSLSSSGVMSADELGTFTDSLDPQPKDAQELAKELVRSRKLTKFQAQVAYQGKARGLVFGEYVVLDKIGEGGMGQVFKARHRQMKRTVAIKLLPPKAVETPEAAQRFEREIEAAAKLIHQNIVTAFDAGKANGNYFMAMEYVEGNDLAAIVKQNGPLPVADAVKCLIQAVRATHCFTLARSWKRAEVLVAKVRREDLIPLTP